MEYKDPIERLSRSNRELLALYDINRLLQTPISTEEKLYIILTSLTSDEGFGFSRAHLLLTNQQRNLLEGWLSVGPLTGEQTREIWDGVSAFEHENGNEHKTAHMAETLDRAPFEYGIRSFMEPIKRGRGHPVQTAVSRRPKSIVDLPSCKDQVHPGFLELVSCPHITFIPLVFRDKVLGIMAVEEHAPDRAQDDNLLRTLSIYGNLAAIALENAELTRNLEEKVETQERMNMELQEAQSRILHLDRLSSMGAVAAGVAHEIKNPLNSLIINLDLLKSEIMDGGCGKKEQLRLAGVLEKEAVRINRTMTEFLSYTKSPKICLERTDLHGVIDLVLSLVECQGKTTGIEFVRDYDTEMSDLMIDENRMKQAILNIVINAMQAMPDGGSLKIKTSVRNKKTNGTTKPGEVNVEFTDTGCGIPSKSMWKLFDPFYTTKDEGTGMGLPIVDSIIRQHGGKVGIDSVRGKGTTVTLTLPMPDQDERCNMALFGEHG
ncbi:MAG TPA: ATP-binding protein [Nitrospirota bacterium]